MTAATRTRILCAVLFPVPCDREATHGILCAECAAERGRTDGGLTVWHD